MQLQHIIPSCVADAAPHVPLVCTAVRVEGSHLSAACTSQRLTPSQDHHSPVMNCYSELSAASSPAQPHGPYYCYGCRRTPIHLLRGPAACSHPPSTVASHLELQSTF
jgi:hypothetical protein